ncbi:MAG: tol-pal system protein YbgF [Gammaproteobacteria bacterium]|nr:tol-pal system protein YbgF [Gammaproteobacteria bacterium]
MSFVLCTALSLSAQDEDRDPVFDTDSPTPSNDQSTEENSPSTEDGVTVFPQSESPATTFDRDDFQLGFLIERVRELQEENSRMLGRIEKLEHEVQLLRHENRDRYVELDKQILELSGHAPVSTGAVSTAPADSEAGMYRNAFSMIEDGSYEEAVGLLENMIKSYPNGAHLPDAFYWLGQTYAQMEPPKLEEARQNLVQLYRLFPKHAKTPEGVYKLGTILDEMGDKPKALEYLDRVVNDYPDTTAAHLAEEYASTIRNE